MLWSTTCRCCSWLLYASITLAPPPVQVRWVFRLLRLAGWPPWVRDHFLILFFLCGASPIVATELLQKGIVLADQCNGHNAFCAVQNGCWTSQPWLLDLRLSNWLIISFLTTPEMYVDMPVMLHVQFVFCDHSTAYTQCYRLECSRWRGDGTNSLYCEWQDSDS